MNEYKMVMSTTDTSEEAKSLARAVVEARLAACVQATTITSTYWWDDAVQNADEFLLLFKTTQDRVEALREFLLANHSYDTPEIVEIPIDGGGAGYLEWITASTRK